MITRAPSGRMEDKKDLACVVNGCTPKQVADLERQGKGLEALVPGGDYCDRCGSAMRISQMWAGMKWRYSWYKLPHS